MSAGQLYQDHRILYHKCSAAGMTGRTPLETVAHNARLRDNPRAVLDGLSTSAAEAPSRAAIYPIGSFIRYAAKKALTSI